MFKIPLTIFFTLFLSLIWLGVCCDFTPIQGGTLLYTRWIGCFMITDVLIMVGMLIGSENA